MQFDLPLTLRASAWWMAYRFAIICLAAGMAGCAAPSVQMPVFGPVPNAYKEPHALTQSSQHTDALVDASSSANAPHLTLAQPSAPWWTIFADPVLERLERQAQAQNTSVQAAMARLDEAQSLLKATHAKNRPQLNFRGNTTSQGGPLINATGDSGNLVEARLELTYQPDWMGLRQAAAEAAQSDATALEHLLAQSRLILSAELAKTYFLVRGLDEEQASLQALSAIDAQRLTISEQRWQLGGLAETEVLRLRREIQATQIQAADISQRRAVLVHALALLCGEAASTFDLPPDMEQTPPNPTGMPAHRWIPNIPPGLPSSLLSRRADIAAARDALQAAATRAGIAEAPWFPNIMISATNGYVSSNVSDLISAPLRTWSLGASLTAGLLDGEQRAAKRAASQAVLDGAAAAYRERVLTAVKEVEDQLSTLQSLNFQAQAQTESLQAAERGVVMAQSRWHHGLSSEFQALDADIAAMKAKRELQQLWAAQAVASVALVLAIGGHWEQ